MINKLLWDNKKYFKALSFAVRKHGLQKLKNPDDLPYLCHFVSVANIALNGCLAEGGNWNLDFILTVALLHDCLEDTKATDIEIEKEFGKKVADAVKSLSKNKSLLKEERISAAIEEIKKQPKEVWCVKLADRIFNLKDIPQNWTDEHIKMYRTDGRLILKALGEANSVLAKELSCSLKNYKNNN